MRALTVAASLFAATTLAACAMNGVVTSSVETQTAPAGSSVRIETAKELGSGVYIGNGLILTAAHVVSDAPAQFENGIVVGPPTVQLRSDDGDIQKGEVLWINKEYDIAAIRPANPRRFTGATLACRPVKKGEAIRAEGNPFGLKFVTMRGYAASEPSQYSPSWKSAFVTDISMASGMSGGPAYDTYGEVIGINVGVVDPHGNANGATSGFAFIVPSRDVCGLLGRA